jgi:transposase
MKPLSLDLRQRIADALDGKASQTSIADRFAVSLSSVERLAKKKRQGLDLMPGVGTGRIPKIKKEQLPEFEALAHSRTDWTAQGLAEAWQGKTGTQVSVSTVTRTLAKAAFVFKKNAASPWSGSRRSETSSGSK